MQWYGKPIPQNRFLGQVDQDDPTNLPMGLASLCRNKDFARDSGGPTCATTRAGINTAMQCLDQTAPVTGLHGFVYDPVSASDPLLTPTGSFAARCQRPLAFQSTKGSQYESPLGTGRMVAFPATNFTEPTTASAGVTVNAVQASAGNQIFTAYSDLSQPIGSISTMDPKALTMNPYGMKPFGWNWAPGTQILAGEVCTPSTPLYGNGHTYQAQNSGTTAATANLQPVWPLTENGTVTDNPGPNQVVWKEATMVIANRLAPPPQPVLAFAAGSGIPTGSDVYIVITLTNTAGETLPSLPIFISSNGLVIDVETPTLAQLPGWEQTLGPAYIPTAVNVYVALVATGTAAPALSSYNLYGIGAPLGSIGAVSGAGGGAAPPNFCSARVTPGQLPTPTTEPAIQRSPAGSTVTPPSAPALTLVGGGTFASGTIVNIELTLLNASGETTPGGVASITTTTAGQAVQVALAASYGATVTGVNIYESQTTVYKLYNTGGPYAVGTSPTVTGVASGVAPPTNNSANLPGGQFPSGRDIYVAMTYTNASGETPLGPASSVTDSNSDDAVVVTVATPLGPNNEQLYSISSVGIYEADVPTGTAAPPSSAFALVGYYQPTQQPFILQTAMGANPPVNNTTGPGGAIIADTATGGPNGTQGYRYASCLWINQMETFSGFTVASVVSTIIDEDGWELGVFKVPIGMPNVVGRVIVLSIADATQSGPFNWNGNVDLQVPSQNVVYPQRTLVDGISQSATVFLDNTTTQGILNFSDSYLTADNNVDDRLSIVMPPMGVRIDYMPSIDQMAVVGVPGLVSGVYISLSGDYESFDGDTSPVPIVTNGERCFGVTDKYKGLPFALMEESGFLLNVNTGDPSSWKVERRWDGMGPCGFRAWDANGKMIVFAHRSGFYKYDESDPDMMSKEIPKLWSSINWNAASCISVTIDEDTHVVHILVPTGSSTVPNQDFMLSYIEGWGNPIHFSTFASKEISMDAARRWSPHDISAFVCLRMKRTLPPNGDAFLNGPSWNTLPDSSYQLTQLLFASSGGDGTVQARTPGIFSDNGAGIDDQYETMSNGLLQAMCKPEGFNLNACGNGQLFTSFIASRAEVSDTGGEQKLIQVTDELVMDPIDLTPQQIAGITSKCEPSVNEFWRVRLTNGKQPGAWNSLKSMTTYVIPMTGGRDPGDN